jgi:hypothetical protein
MTKSKTCVGAVVAIGAAAGLLALSSWAPTPAVAGGHGGGGGETGFPDETYSATAVVTGLPGIVSFDISYVDAKLGKYVLGDRTNKSVDLVDTTTLVGTLLTASPPFAGATGNNNTSGPDGVIIVPKANNGDGTDEVWAGDGPSTVSPKCSLTAASTVPQAAPRDINCSTVKVIDLTGAHATLHVIPTGGVNRADENCLDTADNLLMTANNADSPPFGSIISTKDFTVKSQISFTNSTNGAEQCQWSPRTGMFYITIPGVETPDNGHGVVEVIDPKSGKIVKTFDIPLEVCGTPQGMAVGPEPQILIGCNEGSGLSGNNQHSSIIINERNGSIIAVLPFESGPDEVYYNPGTAEYFLAQSGTAPTCAPTGCTGNQLLGVVDATFKQNDASVITANKSITGRSAHSVAADSVTKKVFVPSPAGVALGCGSTAADATGCIAVYTTKNPDKGAPIVGRNGDDDDHGHGHDHDQD